MKKQQPNKATPDLHEVQARIASWRAKRSHKHVPMPRDLWLAAASLAQTHGVSPVARVLGVGYAALKRYTAEIQDKAAPSTSAVGTFVEVPSWQVLGMSGTAAPAPALVLTLWDSAGARMELRLRDAPVADAASVARTVWSSRQ